MRRVMRWAARGMAALLFALYVGLRLDLFPSRSWAGPTFLVLLGLWAIFQFLSAFAKGMKESEQEHRLARGLCLGCGYSLRGNTSGRCPECGKPIQPDSTPLQ